jgi:hypothetical protein
MSTKIFKNKIFQKLKNKNVYLSELKECDTYYSNKDIYFFYKKKDRENFFFSSKYFSLFLPK